MKKILLFLLLTFSTALSAQFDNAQIKVGAERMEQYLPMLEGQKVALVVNQTSMVKQTHLVDTLLSRGVDVVKIFAPEHGFRGTADAGESVKNATDVKTNLPIISLYGKNKKPTSEQVKGLDWVIFDIQDVGARFYTYISTMHYVMETCGENGVKFMVLDRPNPNGHYVDGPVLEKEYQSFVGMHPIPVVHGMTVGELACMIVQEGWLKNQVNCQLEIVTCEGYTHKSFYQLPVKPSPNLPNMESIYLYPHLCFFEGTPVSVGRGTDQQFQVVGHPDYALGSYRFMPKSGPGSKYPKHENQWCHGQKLNDIPIAYMQQMKEFNITWFLMFSEYFQKGGKSSLSKPFFNENLFIDKLAGTAQFRKDVMAGKSENEIRAAWKEDVEAFKVKRKEYLLYEDF